MCPYDRVSMILIERLILLQLTASVRLITYFNIRVNDVNLSNVIITTITFPYTYFSIDNEIAMVIVTTINFSTIFVTITILIYNYY